MDQIRHIVREILTKQPDKCNCGCHSCENVGNPGPVLNESLTSKIVMTENMKYHVENRVPINENLFRYGSDAFLDMWAEARYLYSRNAIHVNDTDKEILVETDLGGSNHGYLGLVLIDEEYASIPNTELFIAPNYSPLLVIPSTSIPI